MPTYEYHCNECGERFDYFQSMSSKPLRVRPDCKLKNCSVKRIISGGTGLIFKGSGFYLTDYTDKGKKKNFDKKPSDVGKKKKKTKKEIKNKK